MRKNFHLAISSFSRTLPVLMLLFSVSVIELYAKPGEPTKGIDNAPAQKSVITGKVIEKSSKKGMEYANISIFNSADSSLVSGGITTPEGTFRIGKLDAGVYYVDANFIGFNKTRINNIRIPDQHSTIDLGIVPLEASTQQISDVEVVAERARVEYKVDKKVINVAQDINAAGGTAVDVLENTPSVQVDIEGNVTVRGSSNFTVFIDGRPSPLSGSDALQQIPASALQNIEIITNPSAKYDPDGMAGIINLVTKKNALFGMDGIINVSGSTTGSNTLDFTINHKNAKRQLTFGFDTGSRKFSSERESTRETYTTDSTIYMTADGERNYDRYGNRFKAGVDLYLTEKTTLGINASAGTYNFDTESEMQNYYFTTPMNTKRFTLEVENTDRNNTFVDANINFLHKYNEDGTHKLEGLFNYRNRSGEDVGYQSEIVTDEHYDYTMPALYDLKIKTTEGEDSEDFRFKLDYTKPLGQNGKLEAGIQSRIENESEDYAYEDYLNEDNNSKYSSRSNFKQDIHSAYSTLTGKISKLEVMAGLRGEYTYRNIQHTGSDEAYKLDRFDLFPSLHSSYELFKGAQLMASYSRRINRPGGRELDPFETVTNKTTIRKGNPGLKPEYTNSYDLSFMKQFGSRSFFSVEGFFRETNNVISRLTEVRNDGIFVMSYGNVARDKSLGSELMLNLNLAKWLMLNTSVSIYQYQLEGEVLGEDVSRKSTNQDGRINATFRFPNDARVQIMGMYRGPSVSAQGERDASFFSNISYRQDFMKKKLSATLSVQDIFGSSYYKAKNSGNNFKSTFNYGHDARVVQLTLSYKLNNYKVDKKEGGMNEMEFEGGDF